MGIKEINNFEINFLKFREYLKNKYFIEKAFYFLGFFDEKNKKLYREIEKAGFILEFRSHNLFMLGKNKGNVDSDIIFQIMKKIYKNEKFNKIVLISGDGDYIKLVEFLIEENRFKKILFPNKKFVSSLYKKIGHTYYDYIENIKNKISK